MAKDGTVTIRRLEFALARELGMTHAELMQRMSVAEFQEWQVLLDQEAKEREPKPPKKGKATAGLAASSP